MKVMKKILTMLFVMMMVLGMGTAVSAEGTPTSGASPTVTGTIKVNGAIDGQTYTIYKILDLNSYDADNNRYSYTIATKWSSFFASGAAGAEYISIDSDGYAIWNTSKNNTTDVAEFAKKALKFAKDNSIVNDGAQNASSTTVSFTGLGLGYYLLDSTAGTLCSINTTNPEITIQEKNGKPTVKKEVKRNDGTFESSNAATLGEIIEFKTTITAQPGAQNYKLHDKMTAELEFVNDTSNSLKVQLVKADGSTTTNLTSGTDYTLVTTSLANNCTFEIQFEQSFCDTLGANDKIVVTYYGKLSKDAVVDTEYKNETWLGYGDSSNTTNSTTTTKTYSIPLFKYYLEGTDKKELKDAEFALYKKDATGKTTINLVSKSSDPTTGDTYRKAVEGDLSTVSKIKTPTSGKLSIVGLGAGTYLLEETTAPNGFNKLKKKIEIKIDDEGTITYGDEGSTSPSTLTTGNSIEIENNSGTLLPSTGGVGTTMMYIVGAALLIGSGVLLITKKNAK